MFSKQQILKVIENNAGKLRRFGVKRIGLFGSYLYGTAKETSDIDLIVEFSNKTFDNYMETKLLLEDLFNCQVDLIPVESLKPALKINILEEVEYAAGL